MLLKSIVQTLSNQSDLSVQSSSFCTFPFGNSTGTSNLTCSKLGSHRITSTVFVVRQFEHQCWLSHLLYVVLYHASNPEI